MELGREEHRLTLETLWKTLNGLHWHAPRELHRACCCFRGPWNEEPGYEMDVRRKKDVVELYMIHNNQV